MLFVHTTRAVFLAQPTAARAAGDREVLRQFIAVGRGLEAAHGKGLVHRDFKPDNVLIGEDGRPRVVDFGLARLVAGPDPERAAVTETAPGDAAPPLQAAIGLTTHGAILGTPLYMAPEQMRGEPADEKSDQFGFCVALYEALYRQRPFAGDSLDALRQATESGDLAPVPGDAAVAAPIRKALIRGLSPDPADRFATMGELLTALEQWPRQRQRHRLLGLAGVAVLAAGAGLYATGGTVPDPCTNAAQPMDDLWPGTARDAVHRAFLATNLDHAASTASHVAAELDRHAAAWRDESRAACQATHVERTQSTDQLDRRSACLDRARGQLAALVDQLRQLGPADARAVNRAPAEDAERAQELLTRAGNLAESSRHDLLIARIRNDQVLGAYRNDSSLDRARDLSERALAALRRVDKPRRHHAIALRHRGLIHYKAGQLDRAEEYQRRSLEVLGDEFPYSRALSLHDLGNTQRKQHRFNEARSVYDLALAMFEPMLGPSHPHAVAVGFEIAMLHIEQGQLDRARAGLNAVLDAYRHGLGPEHRRVGEAHLELAEVMRRQGELAGALGQARAGLAILQRIYPGDHVELARVHTRVGAIAYRRGEFASALDRYRDALAVHETHRGGTGFAVGLAWANIAEALVALDRFADGRDAIEKARAMLAENLDRRGDIDGFVRSVHGRAWLGLGQLGKAHYQLETAVERLAALPGDPMAMERADASWALARALAAQGRKSDGREFARRALDVYQAQSAQVACPTELVRRWLK